MEKTRKKRGNQYRVKSLKEQHSKGENQEGPKPVKRKTIIGLFFKEHK